MAIQFCDDFGSYGSTSRLVNGVYASVGFGVDLVADPDPNATGTVLRQNSGSGYIEGLRKVLTTPRTTIGVSLRLWMATLPNTNAESAVPVSLCDGSNNIYVTLWVTTTGALHVLQNSGVSGGTILAQTTGPVLVANAWNHIEMKTTIGVSGSVAVRVNGVEVINETGIDTKGARPGTDVEQVRIDYDRGTGSAGITVYYKDYVIWDDTGSLNNDFLGTVRCIRLPVDGDVSLGDWTPSSGSTGWNLLNEVPPSDTSYIAATAPTTNTCVMDFQNLPPDITSVRALMTLIRANNSDGGDGQLQTSLVSNGNDDSGLDRQITVAPTYWFDVSEVDPNTSAQWTPAGTDAAQLRFDRTL